MESATTAAAPPDVKGISIFPVLLVNFINALGFAIVLPFLVFVVADFGGDALVYGLLAATYPAFQLIGAPLLGKWSDVKGRRKVLLLSQAGTLLSWCIFLYAFHAPAAGLLPLVILFVARAFDGLTGGNISVANAYLADISTDEEKSRNYGKMAVSGNMGFVVGPAIAGLLGATALGYQLPILVALAVSLVATVVILAVLPESKKCVTLRQEALLVSKVLGQEHKECIEEEHEEIRLKDALMQPHVPFLLLLYFLIFLGFNFFYTAFPVHALTGLNWSPGDIGTFFAVLGLMMAFVQGPVLGWLSKRVSEPALIIAGNVILVGNFLMLTSESRWLVYGSAVLFAVGNGIMWPSVMSILAKVAGDKYQGSVQGFAGSFGGAASIVGLVLGGILYGAIGAATFVVSAVVLGVVAVLAVRLRPIVAKVG